MLNNRDLAASISAYEENVRDSIQNAKQITLPNPTSFCFTTYELDEDKIKALAELVTTGHKKNEIDSEFIYLFKLCSGSGFVSPQETMNAFLAQRDFQKSEEYTGKKNLCRDNGISPNCRALYVGRTYSPRERFKQHLRSSKASTYAIHFGDWASQLQIRIEFSLYEFSGAGDRTIQLLEDGLWDHLKPMFGRRGER